MQDGSGQRVIPGMSWDEAREVLATALIRMVDADDRSDLEDLVQDAAVRVHRALATAEIRDARGFLGVVARRTWLDHLRARRRAQALRECLTQEADPPHTLSTDALGDPRDRLQLVVEELFRRESNITCGELSRAYFLSRDWREVAAEVGLTHDTVRKRWSRCVRLLRERMREDADLSAFLNLTPGGVV